MKKVFLVPTALIVLLMLCGCDHSQVINISDIIPPPTLNNNPQLDVILTNHRPILSVGNPKGMHVSYKLDYELSSNPEFPEDNTLTYTGITQANKYISEFQVKKGDELKDGTYYWRARTHTSDGKTSAQSDIEGTEIKNNDTYRNIIDFKAVNTRYYRLVIYSQNALQAQLNSIIPYTRGELQTPDVPEDKYALLIGNQMNGYTYTNLAKFVEDRDYKSLTIPHYQMSLEVLRNLKHKPMAITFSGNNADWQYLPMFEYYGEFEIYREVYDIPMMGICAGNEFYAMAYGISFANWMGWFDDTMFRLTEGETLAEVRILPEFVDDPIFKNVLNPFRAVEIHSWAISPISALFMEDERYSEFHVTSKTSYVQTIKSSERPAYSEQFHGAVINEYNQGDIYLGNFLEIAENYGQGK